MASHALRFGPYSPPRVRVGEFVSGNPDIAQYAAEGAAALNGTPESRSARARAHAATLRAKPGWADHMRALGHRRRKKQP